MSKSLIQILKGSKITKGLFGLMSGILIYTTAYGLNAKIYNDTPHIKSDYTLIQETIQENYPALEDKIIQNSKKIIYVDDDNTTGTGTIEDLFYDIDGDRRPQGLKYDIGADEYFVKRNAVHPNNWSLYE